MSVPSLKMIKDRNTLDVKFSDRFDRQLRDAPEEIKEAFLATLDLFLEDPHNPFLRNHPLQGKFAGLQSIDVTDDVRAVFKEAQTAERTLITFHMLGTHKELYG